MAIAPRMATTIGVVWHASLGEFAPLLTAQHFRSVTLHALKPSVKIHSRPPAA
jgi:hypothetical protein